MKFTKLFSAASAIAVAASALALSASAAFTGVQETDVNGAADSVQFVAVNSDDFHTAVAADKLDKVAGFTFNVTVKEKGDYEGLLAEGTSWFGGAVGANSPSTGWKNLASWGVEGGEEDIIWQATDKRGVYTVTFQGTEPIFKTSDQYALLWIQDYSADKTFTYTISDVVLLDVNGNDVLAAPAEEEKPAEEETPVVEESEEESEESEESEEPVDESEESTEETEAEVDWDSYDEEAAAAANEAFVFGQNETIDLYAVLGDDLYDLNKVEATFTWTAGTGWCGGGGIGGGIVLSDGSTWLSGPEYGAANANEGIVDDGVATQTVIDLGDNTIEEIATVGDDGVT
ncbi:MAG: hypothetical protein ACI4Q4_00630, partial [Oscillospiraceae bacterium]